MPLQTHVKNDKRGLGAEKKKKNTANRLEDPVTESADDNVSFLHLTRKFLNFSVNKAETVHSSTKFHYGCKLQQV